MLAERDWEHKAREYQADFANHARGLLSAAIAIADHECKRPDGVTFHATLDFRMALSNIERAVALVRKAFEK